MTIKINEIVLEGINPNYKNLLILPENFFEHENHRYHSTSISFQKFANKTLPTEYLSTPEVLIEQRSGEWFAPVIMFTSVAINEYPEIVSIAFTIIRKYLEDFFKGQSESAIRLKILHKATQTTSITELTYEGDIKGLDKLEQAVLEITKK